MASFVKFENFTEDLANGVHNLGSDTLEIYLSNAAPNVATHEIKADIAEIATGSGYTGPQDTTNTLSRTGGITSILGVDVVITASGGTIGPFQYVILQNTTPAGPVDPLIGYWDRGSALTLNDGESFTTDFTTEMFTIT